MVIQFWFIIIELWMNITRSSFTENLQLIKSIISSSHYFSVDLQMSGILNKEEDNTSKTDSFQVRYEKIRSKASTYLPLQFGLTAFQIHPKSKEIIAYPFNFYIFPLSSHNMYLKMIFHTGTLTFLSKNNFDFNQLIYQGIPFTSNQNIQLAQESKATYQILKDQRNRKIFQSPDIKAFVSMKMLEVREWMKDTTNLNLEINLKFIKFNATKMLMQQISEEYGQVGLQFRFDSEQIFRRSKMIIVKVNEAAKPIEEATQKKKPQQLFNEVINALSLAKKPIILHNGFLDLMYIYQRFIQELPETWSQYAKNVHAAFPYVYDNKYLFNYSPILLNLVKQTNLMNCFSSMKKSAMKEDFQFKIHPNFSEYSIDQQSAHEAGFDSLMTGYAFLNGLIRLDNTLENLKNHEEFFIKNSFLRNKIPQGSIKNAFNLEAYEHDSYIEDGIEPLYIKSVTKVALDEKDIRKYFNQKYGSCNVVYTNRTNSQFCLLFLDQKDLSEFLKNEMPNGQVTLINIASVDCLVLNREIERTIIRNSQLADKQL